MNSLARTDDARKDILELCTHTPRKSGNTIDFYITFPWEALFAEVAKFQVKRHERDQSVRLPLAASAERESPEAAPAPVPWLSRGLCELWAHPDGFTKEARLLAASASHEVRESQFRGRPSREGIKAAQERMGATGTKFKEV